MYSNIERLLEGLKLNFSELNFSELNFQNENSQTSTKWIFQNRASPSFYKSLKQAIGSAEWLNGTTTAIEVLTGIRIIGKCSVSGGKARLIKSASLDLTNRDLQIEWATNVLESLETTRNSFLSSFSLGSEDNHRQDIAMSLTAKTLTTKTLQWVSLLRNSLPRYYHEPHCEDTVMRLIVKKLTVMTLPNKWMGKDFLVKSLDSKL